MKTDPISTWGSLRAALALVLLLGLGGCATGPDPRDPLEPFNRNVMKFNEGVDAIVLKPAATVYREALPPLVRTGVSNFFGNLSDAWSFVNSALQLRFQDAAENLMRVNVNTFFGLGGILDVASEMNIERHREDFGQTLGRWGVGTGPFVMLPILGPSTLRDTFALPLDLRVDPVRRVTHASPRNSLYVLRAVDVRSNLLQASNILDEAALDKYSFTRDAHLQRRRGEVFQFFRRGQGDDAGSDGGSVGVNDAASAPGGSPTTAPSMAAPAPAGATAAPAAPRPVQ
jgi:phospholipid-binding lipoprotein MlaA